MGSLSSISSSDLEGREKLLEFRREKKKGQWVKEEIRSKIEEKVKERDKVKFEIMREKRK
jgi:hypothetical protein